MLVELAGVATVFAVCRREFPGIVRIPMDFPVEAEWNRAVRIPAMYLFGKPGQSQMKPIRRLMCVAAAGLVLGVGPLSTVVQACPGCKTANETESRRPRAYMMSILFMLGMPATIVTGFGFAFYRMSRQSPEQAALLQQFLDQQAEQQRQQDQQS